MKFRLRITDDMVSGTYTLSYVKLEDACGNTATYYSSRLHNDLSSIPGYESVRFTVDGLPHDHEPPTVDSVIMDEPGKTVTVGDTLAFYVSTEDNIGLDIANSYLGFMCTCHLGPYSLYPPPSPALPTPDPSCSPDPSVVVVGYKGLGATYNAQTKQAKFELQITGDMHSGKYTLRSVGILDICGNFAIFAVWGPDGPWFEGAPGNRPGTIEFENV